MTIQGGYTDVTIIRRAWHLNIILTGSVACPTQKEARRSPTHKLREGVELKVSCQVAVLHRSPPGDVQIPFLWLEAEESLDPGKWETVNLSWSSHTWISLHHMPTRCDREAYSLFYPWTTWLIRKFFIRLHQYLAPYSSTTQSSHICIPLWFFFCHIHSPHVLLILFFVSTKHSYLNQCIKTNKQTKNNLLTLP